MGVYSHWKTDSNGVIIDDSGLDETFTESERSVRDGMSNTILLTERPPSADGDKGWWDSRCCLEDTMSPVKGNRRPYSSGQSGNCPDIAFYGSGDYQDRCAFSRVWSFHNGGATFCMADGSVRIISYDIAQQTAGGTTLLEALASRAGREIVPGLRSAENEVAATTSIPSAPGRT